MSPKTTAPPAALDRARPLLTVELDMHDVGRGYLDLLGDDAGESPGAIQRLWASGIGSTLYDYVQAGLRSVASMTRLPDATLRLPAGASVLDVGCGPGNMTGKLAAAAGPDGLALGLDISRPMLERAASAEAAPNVGFIRGDARRLPFHDGGFDAVTSLLVLQLIPEPMAVLGEMARVMKPGARLTALVPTAAGSLFHRVSDLTGNAGGVEFFEPEEIADTLLGTGLEAVHTRQVASLLWFTATKPRS